VDATQDGFFVFRLSGAIRNGFAGAQLFSPASHTSSVLVHAQKNGCLTPLSQMTFCFETLQRTAQDMSCQTGCLADLKPLE